MRYGRSFQNSLFGIASHPFALCLAALQVYPMPKYNANPNIKLQNIQQLNVYTQSYSAHSKINMMPTIPTLSPPPSSSPSAGLEQPSPQAHFVTS